MIGLVIALILWALYSLTDAGFFKVALIVWLIFLLLVYVADWLVD